MYNIIRYHYADALKISLREMILLCRNILLIYFITSPSSMLLEDISMVCFYAKNKIYFYKSKTLRYGQ